MGKYDFIGKYDFALQWADYLDIKVYNKGNQVLKYEGKPKYNISPLNTSIKIGQELGEEDETPHYTYLSFLDYERLGYAIRAVTDFRWKQNQKVCYEVMRKSYNSYGITYDAFRKSGMRIEHDAQNRRFRLIGENVIADETLRIDSGIGPWIIYDESKPKTTTYRAERELEPEDVRTMFQEMFDLSPKKELKPQIIKELPLLKSEEKYIVCAMPTDSTYRILVTGKARQGKSLFVHGISDRLFLSGERVGWLIDPQNQFYNMGAPQDHGEFNKINSLINNEPKPVPVVLLYLACKYPSIISHPNISFKLTLNFLEFLNKYSFYTYGTADWKIAGSERYLKSMINKIKDCKNAEDIEEEFYEAMPESKDKKKGAHLRSMIFKMKATFDSIFKEMFTSNLYEDDSMAADELEIHLPNGNILKGHPFIVLMESGFITIINNSIVPDKTWVRNYLADLMQKIMLYQKEMKQLKRSHKLNLMVDEMQAIYEEMSGRRKDACSQAFEMLFRQGAFNEIGFCGNTQSLEKMNKELLKNATHICCVSTQSKAERKIIQDIFTKDDVPDEVINQLSDLKTQEIMIFSNEGFVIYDKFGKRKEIDNRKWFKGRIIPPVSYHMPPVEKKEELETPEEIIGGY